MGKTINQQVTLAQAVEFFQESTPEFVGSHMYPAVAQAIVKASAFKLLPIVMDLDKMKKTGVMFKMAPEFFEQAQLGEGYVVGAIGTRALGNDKKGMVFSCHNTSDDLPQGQDTDLVWQITQSRAVKKNGVLVVKDKQVIARLSSDQLQTILTTPAEDLPEILDDEVFEDSPQETSVDGFELQQQAVGGSA